MELDNSAAQPLDRAQSSKLLSPSSPQPAIYPSRLSIGSVAWAYFRDRPWIVFLYILLSFYYPIRVVITPYLIGKVTSELSKDGDLSVDALKRTGMWIVIAWVVSIGMRTALSLMDASIGPQYHSYVRNRTLDYVLNSYRRNYREIETGDVLVKLYNLPESCYRAVRSVRNSLIPITLAIFCGLVVFALLNRTLMWIYLGFIVVLIIMFICMTYGLFDLNVETMEARDRLHEDIDDFLGNTFSLYVTDTVRFEQRRLCRATKPYNRLKQKSWTRHSFFHMGSSLMKVLFVAAMLIAVAVMRYKGLVAVVAPLIFIIFTLDTVLYTASIDYMSFLEKLSSITKMQRFLDRTGKRRVPCPPDNRQDAHKWVGRIVYDDMRVVREGRADPVLKDVSLTIEPGKRVLVTGPIGGGKSTLTRLLAGLVPYQGSVTIDGYEISKLSAAEISKVVTYIPQDPRLLNRTILENILHGHNAGEANAPTRAQVQAIVDHLDIPGFPLLDAMAGKCGNNLSGGQRAIAYLIRAFFRKAPIVVLDEPTAALDPVTKATVQKIVKDLFPSQTVIIITHDFSVHWNAAQHILVKGHTARNTRVRLPPKPEPAEPQEV